ncbi:MAG: DUF6913 domain-containing protein [Salibacteraceae bacterium]
MIGFLANTIGKWKLERAALNSNRISEAINLSEMKSAILIFDLTEKLEYQKIVEFVKLLKSENVKQVEVIGFTLNKEIPTFINKSLVKVLGKDDINFFGIPSENFCDAIFDQSFDVMIDCTRSSNIPTDFLLANINAKTKVGSPQKETDEYFDLLVNTNNNELNDYMKNVIHFLKMINKR